MYSIPLTESTELRTTLTHMHLALGAMRGGIGAGFAGVSAASGVSDFADAVERDVNSARGAIGLVLSRERITILDRPEGQRETETDTNGPPSARLPR